MTRRSKIVAAGIVSAVGVFGYNATTSDVTPSPVVVFSPEMHMSDPAVAPEVPSVLDTPGFGDDAMDLVMQPMGG